MGGSSYERRNKKESSPEVIPLGNRHFYFLSTFQLPHRHPDTFSYKPPAIIQALTYASSIHGDGSTSRIYLDKHIYETRIITLLFKRHDKSNSISTTNSTIIILLFRRHTEKKKREWEYWARIRTNMSNQLPLSSVHVDSKACFKSHLAGGFRIPLGIEFEYEYPE